MSEVRCGRGLGWIVHCVFKYSASYNIKLACQVLDASKSFQMPSRAKVCLFNLSRFLEKKKIQQKRPAKLLSQRETGKL